MNRPTHDRLVALRQTSWIPREGKKGGGKTWPASFFTFDAELAFLAADLLQLFSYVLGLSKNQRGTVLRKG